MKRLVVMFAAASICILSSQLSRLFAAETSATIVVHGPTIVAFFPPITKAELEKDADANETLADFQAYVARVREPLRKSGVELHELYAHSFQLRVGKTVTTFHPSKKEEVGYYFIAPGKKPRIEYGVLSNVELLDTAREYFGMPAQ